MTCSPHAYQKFDDSTIFCPKCGDSKPIAGEAWVEKLMEAMRALPQHVCYPHVCPPCTRPHYYPTFTWGGTTSSPSITVGGTSSGYPPNTTVTYTANDIHGITS